ncbi:MAG: hypothetical protein H7Y05_11270 [Steroidobacteraceae bacterium]|nr:hypothetical protein [Deltaproteobacteria bacterium]
MKKLLFNVLLVAAFMTGCAGNYYNVPTENFADKVKVLGIAPIFIDVESDIRYPQKDLLIQLSSDLNRKYEPQLVRKLKATGNFYTVVPLDGDPTKLFNSLMFRREKRDDATIQYNKYFWKDDELRSYIQKNSLDAVMLITVSGLTKNEKIYSSNSLTSLETDYNYLTLTAQILDASGTVLWEYPNFRRSFVAHSPLINLQYPDFSESDANLSRQTEVKFKTLDGIRRTLDHKRKDWLQRETQESEAYGEQFEEIISLIKFDLNGVKKNKSTATEPPRQSPVDASKSTEPGPEPSQTATPAPMPPQQSIEPAKATAISTEEAPATNSDEIVPATDSTR